MIDKKDLRIGNSVSYKGEIWKVEELSDTAAHLSQHPLWVRGHYDNLHPIPITEEALVKMGFEKDNYGGFKHKNLFSSFIKRPDYTFKSENVFYFLKVGDDKDEPEIKYVHQLQNLYYALTQTELSYE